ncbi:baseplate wedge subunit [Serratia phage CHI14]|uniref:Baseplate wedge subunit n=2 Tax=Winklervirus chi14 TaxID=2560752 RepID=A0A1Z1LYG6_9CAUD|nr:baseplate wedge subunit [Serratia phage CHI14]ARW57583.1 baseplate wedge subunit [Serratia phage CHI14]ARW57858.1 baseplate wedge subunit [Serratia phage CBH8]
MLNSSVIYRAIVTSKFRTEKMHNFYQTIGDDKNQNTLFITFGRSEPWSENETEPGFAPPYPNDSVEGVVDMWTHMMGSVKVMPSMLDAVTPRKDWGDIRFPNPRNFQIDEIVVSNTAPYNRTDVGSGWMVYRCVDIPEIGTCSIASIDNKEECIKLGGVWTATAESVYPPRGRGDTEGMIDLGDGYLWEYLYEIPADVSINRCTNEYIVVPWPDEVEEDPERWGYQNNLSWQHNDFGIIYRVKAYTIRFKAYLDSVYFPEASLPGNKGFRQISLIINPLEKKVHPSDPNVKAVKEYYNVVDMERHSGEMVYMENRPPIIRSMDQTEEINLIFEF